MLGPLDAQAKVRKAPAQRRPKAQLGAVVAPEELVLQEEQDKQETDRNMEEMWGVGVLQGVTLTLCSGDGDGGVIVMGTQSLALLPAAPTCCGAAQVCSAAGQPPR
jgi:hypothetical protein